MVEPAKSWTGSGAGAAPAGCPLRALTLVFTDLRDSTGLKQRLGDAAAGELIERHRRHVRDLVGVESGRIGGCAGDGFLLTFDTPSAALRFALDLQQVHADDPALPAVRIGIHQGEVAAGPDDPALDGVEVDTAARLGALARPGQILLSIGALRSAKAHVRADREGRPIGWRTYGEYRLRGLQDAVAVGEAGVEGIAPFTAPRRDSPAVAPPGFVRRTLSGRPFAVAASVAVLCLGVLVPYLIAHGPGVAKPTDPPTEQAPTPSAEPKAAAPVRLRAAWGRAGHPGRTFPRPQRPGADDYLNLFLVADAPGDLYVFRIAPDGSAAFQAPDYRDQSGACTALAAEPGRELHFGTYRLDDPPGRYWLVAVLASEPVPDLCDRLEADLSGAASEEAIRAAVEGGGRADLIAGVACFVYVAGGDEA